MRITKVYTRTGDKGKTRLAGGQQVWKDCLRVEAYGAVDELNAVIGLASAMIEVRSPDGFLQSQLRWMQNKLFDIGGLLATVPGQSFAGMPKISSADIIQLERLMDNYQKFLPMLKEFILPGGGLIGSQLHIARTVCRRAERRCVSLSRKESVDPSIIVFLNRLSDALFVVGRWMAKKEGKREMFWKRTATVTPQAKKTQPQRKRISS